MLCTQSKTKVKLGATAGLRLLPGGKSDAILASVTKFLQASPFAMDAKTGVTVLNGELCSAVLDMHASPEDTAWTCLSASARLPEDAALASFALAQLARH